MTKKTQVLKKALRKNRLGIEPKFYFSKEGYFIKEKQMLQG
jgi:hypothetical protein